MSGKKEVRLQLYAFRKSRITNENNGLYGHW